MAKPITICAVKTLSSTSVAIVSTSGITLRMRLRNHHRSVWCNLISHGLSGGGGMALSGASGMLCDGVDAVGITHNH